MTHGVNNLKKDIHNFARNQPRRYDAVDGHHHATAALPLERRAILTVQKARWVSESI